MASCGKRAGGLLLSLADDWARWFAHAWCLWSSHWVQRCRRRCLSSLASHFISSRLVAPIPSLCSHFTQISFSRRPFQGVQNRERGAATLLICIGKEGTQNHIHLFHHTITIFSISPFWTTANLVGSRATTTSHGIGRLGYQKFDFFVLAFRFGRSS